MRFYCCDSTPQHQQRHLSSLETAGELLAIMRMRQPRKSANDWLTGIARNPSNGRIYACNYNGSRVLEARSPSTKPSGTLPPGSGCQQLAYKRRFAQAAGRMQRPEGIAFTGGCAYVATACGSVVQLDGDSGRLVASLQLQPQARTAAYYHVLFA